MFKSVLTIKGAEDLYMALLPEQKDLVTKRAQVTFELNEGDLLIKIIADDFSAFRAMESSLMRLLVTFYKVKKIT